MKTLLALSVALLTSLGGGLLVLRLGANGGLLAGFEVPAVVSVGALTGAVYYLIAQSKRGAQVPLLLQSVVIGFLAPLVVLLGPLAFCIAFSPNASCM